MNIFGQDRGKEVEIGHACLKASGSGKLQFSTTGNNTEKFEENVIALFEWLHAVWQMHANAVTSSTVVRIMIGYINKSITSWPKDSFHSAQLLCSSVWSCCANCLYLLILCNAGVCTTGLSFTSGEANRWSKVCFSSWCPLRKDWLIFLACTSRTNCSPIFARSADNCSEYFAQCFFVGPHKDCHLPLGGRQAMVDLYLCQRLIEVGCRQVYSFFQIDQSKKYNIILLLRYSYSKISIIQCLFYSYLGCYKKYSCCMVFPFLFASTNHRNLALF